MDYLQQWSIKQEQSELYLKAVSRLKDQPIDHVDLAQNVAGSIAGALSGLMLILETLNHTHSTQPDVKAARELGSIRERSRHMATLLARLSRALTENHERLTAEYEENETPLLVQPLLQAVMESYILLSSLTDIRDTHKLPFPTEQSLQHLATPQVQHWIELHMPPQ